MNPQFSNYVQSQAFNLSLSRPMIERLSALHTERRMSLADSHAWSYGGGTNYLLVRRGLVVHHRNDESLLLFREHLAAWQQKTRVEQVWEVTAAGVLVLHLLVEAGLIARVDVARTRSKVAS